MQLHGIAKIRRYRKVGVCDRPYVKDVVVPVDAKLPFQVAAVQKAAGQAMLGYLESIGMSGLELSPTEEDTRRIAEYWQGYPQSGSCKEGGKCRIPTEDSNA